MNNGAFLKKKKNDSGFTLIELVVSVAVMALVVLIAGMFVVASANSYSNLSNQVSINQESKQTLEQYLENALDTAVAVVGDKGTDGTMPNPFYLVEYTGAVNSSSVAGKGSQNTDMDSLSPKLSTQGYLNLNKKYHIRAYYLDKGINDKYYTLYYGELESTTIYANLDNYVSNHANLNYEPLCKNITDGGFNVKVTDVYSDDDGTTFAGKLDVSINLQKRGREFKVNDSNAFRGKTIWAKSFEQLTESPFKEELNDR